MSDTFDSIINYDWQWKELTDYCEHCQREIIGKVYVSECRELLCVSCDHATREIIEVLIGGKWEGIEA